MLSEHFFNTTFECPVFVGLLGLVPEGAERDAELPGEERLGRTAFLHFFFGCRTT